MAVDVVTVEVIRSYMESLAEQMTDTMERTSYSLLIKEGKDCSSSIFDANGRLLAEGANIPVHLNALGPCLRAMLRNEIPADQIEPGDVLLTNDPFIDGSLGAHHTSDFIVYYPIFHGETLLGFSTIFAHLAGTGGVDPEGWHTSIFDEGLRIPPVKLFRRGELDERLFRLILANTNAPYAQKGDILAQVAGARVGAQGFLSLVDKYGLETVTEAIENQIEYAERRTRAYIERIPDGCYQAETKVLEDGSMGGPHRLKLTIEVSGSDIVFDFTGTAEQVAGPINCPKSATISASLFGLMALMPPDIPKNQGTANIVEVRTEPGTLVDPREPAAVYQRMAITHQIVDLVFEAMASAVPEDVVANSCGMVYCHGSAINPDPDATGADLTGRQSWDQGTGPSTGGLGARSTKDGLNGMPGWITNVASPSIESLESEAPVLYLRKELRQDSGGSGEFRGGLGVILSWQCLGYEGLLSHTSQRSAIPPQGLFGGGAAKGSEWVLNEGTERERRLEFQTGPTIGIGHGETLTFYAPGGGGYGRPHQRTPERILDDLESGYISEEHARMEYPQQWPEVEHRRSMNMSHKAVK
ncbi:hydantoinase B/oxoprolinase family protein (plasmid) [Arthrobacter sp. KN11-1C]|uniref:hydantoinase B/oxoprolinase family protein n=1 Tax=Arthrobacter sp. KN11-1C TaxID=3445774 RepID=UPI003FA001D3